MDQSYSESDVSLSPSQILDRLQVLRQLQLLQRGKLQKQRLQYQESTETSSSITEIVSHFSNSTSYNTFRSLLQSSCDTSNDTTPRQDTSRLSPKLKQHDLIEGVAALNLSQESEFIVNSPLSSRSRISASSRRNESPNRNSDTKSQTKKQIALDEMPILSPKQDFEALVLEKLKNEKIQKSKSPNIKNNTTQNKKPFLRRGEGMSRFGVKKTDLIIQNTKSLPWRRKSLETRVVHTPKKVEDNEKLNVDIKVPKLKQTLTKRYESQPNHKDFESKDKSPVEQAKTSAQISVNSSNCQTHNDKPELKIDLPKGKHPLRSNTNKTWAAVLTKEQDDFLRQLKQSDYYKNFTSPAKSTVSDASCDGYLNKLSQEREVAEQNMFELLENKVTHESFNLENSFFNKFLKRTMDCSGESTPLIMQKCLSKNPNLLHIFPEVIKERNKCDSECSCDYTDCSDAASEASCSCSCKTLEETKCSETSTKSDKKKDNKQKNQVTKPKRKGGNNENKEDCHDDTVTETDSIKANMAEMNAKLVATSELLKDRLRELEDEIETFRKQNSDLAKMREEIDLERQKFYEEKNTFEQKLNEEKILCEYYLAEEKERLNKQKQMYERYVREMRGRLNKKEKDEVINLKKEISDLKEEIRNKDAKSTSTIARLRNQLKIMEKEKGNLQEEVEKLKKENRRIQHSNEITRRLTNVKYLEEINKKLSHIAKEPHSEMSLDKDVKYKAFEIERQSRSRKIQPVLKGTTRPRAKSVPNLKVTSRYAKYFSQRDTFSQVEKNETLNYECLDRYSPSYDVQDNNRLPLDDAESVEDNDELPNEDEENCLEKIYMERFQNASPVSSSNRSSLSNTEKNNFKGNPDTFFIRKFNSHQRDSKSPNNTSHQNNGTITNRSKSPISILSNRSSGPKSPSKDMCILNHSGDSNKSVPTSKSPVSILGNRSSFSQRSATIINQEHRDKLMSVSPEPSTSKNSVTKTSLNPSEIKKPDGSKELRFPNGNVKYISADGKYSKFVYYNGDVKENFYNEGRIKYYYAEAKTYHTTHADGLEVLEFPDGQVEKRYKDGSSEIRLPNGSVRYQDPKNEHVREEWRFPDGTALTVAANGEQRIQFCNGQVEVHAKDHKRREFPDGTVKLVYTDGTAETRYASGRVRIKDKHGNLIMDSAPV
ncbi:centromere protein J [Pectinophora gossypiella]|uniref:centromere protein J n=1 Tax=Pectinophora gossypiella TaxID=13191 RepID=UPI00214E0003|nr:centromere protein J [Pectinophora gossypiella]